MGGGAAPAGDDELPRSRTGLLVLIGALLVALILAGAFFVWPRLFEQAPEQVPVPQIINKTQAQARALIGEAGLKVGPIDRENSETVPAGRVIRQDPEPDTYVDPDTPVGFVLSLGVPEVNVPPVIGLDKDAARAQLEADDFEVRLEEKESDEPAGQVVETDPPANTSVEKGSTVVVFYSDGPEEVPDVVGLMQSEAKNKIRAAGFEPRVIEDPDSTEPAGTVTDQSPAAGETPSQGSTVTILVSTYQEPSESPTPTESPTDVPSETPPVLGQRAVVPRSVSPRRPGRAGRRS